MKKFMRTTRCNRAITLAAGNQTLTAAERLESPRAQQRSTASVPTKLTKVRTIIALPRWLNRNR
ncbi:hypothetical protein EB75_27910 [Mycobacterium sp. ST-F2]|nr:hypothetical protein EB75_27910 [Mycobacterium sp. ST-F2]